jgi:hypothetical protein
VILLILGIIIVEWRMELAILGVFAALILIDGMAWRSAKVRRKYALRLAGGFEDDGASFRVRRQRQIEGERVVNPFLWFHDLPVILKLILLTVASVVGLIFFTAGLILWAAITG